MSQHMVHFYEGQDALVRTIADYVGEGLRAGRAGVLIARPAHCAAIEQAVSARGGDPQAARERGQLVVLDAAETMARFHVRGRVSWSDFQSSVGTLIAGLEQSFSGVRAYSEMVDMLWSEGQRDAALSLEAFWNELARRHSFAVLCGYRMDPFDVHGCASVCATHAQVLPASDGDRVNTAVSEAVRDVLDERSTGMLMTIVANRLEDRPMPQGQAILLWLTRHMPRTAERVVAAAQRRLAA
jgi:hypothetical protein